MKGGVDDCDDDRVQDADLIHIAYSIQHMSNMYIYIFTLLIFTEYTFFWVVKKVRCVYSVLRFSCFFFVHAMPFSICHVVFIDFHYAYTQKLLLSYHRNRSVLLNMTKHVPFHHTSYYSCCSMQVESRSRPRHILNKWNKCLTS